MNLLSQSHAMNLRKLAGLWGLQNAYVAANKQRISATPAAMLGVLHAMGVNIDSGADLREAIMQRHRALWAWRLEPVHVAWDGHLPALQLRLPAENIGLPVSCRLEFEAGDSHGWASTVMDAGSPTAEIGGETFVSGQVAVDPKVDGVLPHGYHKLEIEVGGRSLTSLLIGAPRTAFSDNQRTWGAFLPLYALHSARNNDIADFEDLAALMTWLAAKGASFLGLLPLSSLFLDNGLDPSPYAPVSRLFWNELYVRSAVPSPRKTGSSGSLLDYREIATRRRSALEAELERLSTADEAKFQRFRVDHPDVDDYARFRAVQEERGNDWRGWSEPERGGDLSHAAPDPMASRYHAYAQWRCRQQLQSVVTGAKANGMKLYLDLPVGVHPDGYDAWRYQDAFAGGASVGAPPDRLAPDGQNWGFQPLLPEAQRESGYAYLRAFLANQLSVAGMVRVDHVMGLHRLYWVPQGLSGRDGVYVRYPAEEQYAIFNLESHRHQTEIVGENLGTVPARINRSLGRRRFKRMYVLRFELKSSPEPSLKPQPQLALSSLATHDLPPFAAYWTGRDIEQRLRLGVSDPAQYADDQAQRSVEKATLLAALRTHGVVIEDAEDAFAVFLGCTQLLAAGRATNTMINLEDLWQETESQNVPGTASEQHSNWQRRSRLSLEEMQQLASAEPAFEILRTLRPREVIR